MKVDIFKKSNTSITHNIGTIELEDFTIFAGENNSGKTHIVNQLRDILEEQDKNVIFIPAIAFSFIWRIKPNAAFLSMSAGLIAFLGLLVSGYLTPDSSVITLPVAIVFLIIGQGIWGKKGKVLATEGQVSSDVI